MARACRDGRDCAICLEACLEVGARVPRLVRWGIVQPEAVSSVVVLGCTHAMCDGCFANLLANAGRACPTCRAPLAERTAIRAAHARERAAPVEPSAEVRAFPFSAADFGDSDGDDPESQYANEYDPDVVEYDGHDEAVDRRAAADRLAAGHGDRGMEIHGLIRVEYRLGRREVRTQEDSEELLRRNPALALAPWFVEHVAKTIARRARCDAALERLSAEHETLGW